MICRACGQELDEARRFCIRCGAAAGHGGHPLAAPTTMARHAEAMNLPVLYGMIACLALAALFPPWESPPGSPPRFLGFHFILRPPKNGTGGETGGVVSLLLLFVEWCAIAVAGFYGSWLFRKKPRGRSGS